MSYWLLYFFFEHFFTSMNPCLYFMKLKAIRNRLQHQTSDKFGIRSLTLSMGMIFFSYKAVLLHLHYKKSEKTKQA
jgi:hypothetical protein